MRVARRAFLASMLASVAAPAVVRHARADPRPVTLKLHHFFSAVSSGHQKFLKPWARKVEAESGGRVRIDIFPSMQLGGAPAQLFDQARNGLADIVWAMPGDTPGRFAKTETFELPFVASHRALVNSRALTDFAAAHLQDEFQDFHPICLSCRDHGVLHANLAIRAIADVKGLRLHVPNRLAGEAVEALGGHGVIVPVPQLPMAISGHAIDGCLAPWDAVPALRLSDLLKDHTDFAASPLCTSTFVLAMSRAAYDRLPRELKAVIDNNSGQGPAGAAGAMWDLEAKAVADTVRERGDPVTVLTADEIAPWRKATGPVIAAWVKEMRGRKLDGGRLIASARALIEKYANEPEPQPPAPPQRQSLEQTVRKPPAPALPQASQTSAASAQPQANAPVAVTTPTAKPALPKTLDIPL
jgi:TRAP-type transport system periplasmic protein